MELQQVQADQVQVARNQQLRLRRMELEIFDAEQGVKIAYANNDERFSPGRIGGFFQINVPRSKNWRKIWIQIQRATESRRLGYKSSIPTYWRNREYAGRFNADPREYPIWVHTRDSADETDLFRIYLQLVRMGISRSWIKRYKSYYELDARNEQLGRLRLDFRR